MYVWKGKAEDCVIAPNGALYYTVSDGLDPRLPGHNVGSALLVQLRRLIPGDGSDRLEKFQLDVNGQVVYRPMQHKYGPLDLVRLIHSEDRLPFDLVGFPSFFGWRGLTEDSLEEVRLPQMYPLGPGVWLTLSKVGLRIEVERPRPLGPSEVFLTGVDSRPAYLFDESSVVVALGDSIQVIDKVTWTTRVVTIPGLGQPVRWTWDYLWYKMPKNWYAVNAYGKVFEFPCLPRGGTYLALTPDGRPMYSRRGTSGVFVGDVLYDFTPGEAVRGANLSVDGCTAVYWTGKSLVQFDIE